MHVPGKRIVGAGLLVALAASADAPAPSLDDRLAKGEVLIEFAPAEGTAQPPLHVSAVLDAPPEQVFALIDACNGYAGLMPRVASSSEVSRTGENSVCTWVVDMPFPMKDHATEVSATSRRGAGVWTREFKQIRGDFRRNEGLWTLTAFRGDPSRTRVEYRLLVALDTMLPESLVRNGQRDGMSDLVANLRRRLAEKR